jgi:hypothetical protein
MEDRLNTNTTAYGVFESLAVYGFFDYDEDDDSKLPGPSVTERRACTCFKFYRDRPQLSTLEKLVSCDNATKI